MSYPRKRESDDHRGGTTSIRSASRVAAYQHIVFVHGEHSPALAACPPGRARGLTVGIPPRLMTVVGRRLLCNFLLLHMEGSGIKLSGGGRLHRSTWRRLCAWSPPTPGDRVAPSGPGAHRAKRNARGVIYVTDCVPPLYSFS